MLRTSASVFWDNKAIILSVDHNWLGTDMARLTFYVFERGKKQQRRFRHYLLQDEVDDHPSTEALLRNLLE